jgi:hypothetical protein
MAQQGRVQQCIAFTLRIGFALNCLTFAAAMLAMDHCLEAWHIRGRTQQCMAFQRA